MENKKGRNLTLTVAAGLMFCAAIVSLVGAMGSSGFAVAAENLGGGYLSA